MMGAFVLKLVNMSISASWVVLAVVVLRFALRKAPKSVRVLLWGLVALRLLFPFSFKSPTSVLPSAEVIPVQQVSDHSLRVNTGFEAVDVPVNTYISANRTQSLAEPETKSFDLSYVWLIGAAALALYGIFSFLRLRKKVSPSKKLSNGVYICDYIDSPFILGVVRPRIYLPSSLTEAETEHVLSHEQAHIKRLDYVWKPLGFVLLCIYWFNPVIWLSYVLLCRDIELACDERVIKDMETADIQAYSQTLLNLSVSRRMILSCPVAFGEVGVKSRIKSILNYKKPAFWVILIAIIAVIAVTVCLLTDPAHGDSYIQYMDEMYSSELGRIRQFKASFDSDINYVTFTLELWQDGDLIHMQNITHNADMDGFDVSFDCNWEEGVGLGDVIGVAIRSSDGEEIYSAGLNVENGWKYSVWEDVARFVWEVETYGELITDQTIQQLYNISDGDEYILTAAVFSYDTVGSAFYSCDSLSIVNPEAGSAADKATILVVRATFTADPPAEKASRDEAIEFLESIGGNVSDELVEYIQSIGVEAFEKIYSRLTAQIEYESAQYDAGRLVYALGHAYIHYKPNEGDIIPVYCADGTVKEGKVELSDILSGSGSPIATVSLENNYALELYHFGLNISVNIDGEVLSNGKYKDGGFYPVPYTAGYDMLVLRSPDGFCDLLCIEPTEDTTLYENEDNYEAGIYSWFEETYSEYPYKSSREDALAYLEENNLDSSKWLETVQLHGVASFDEVYQQTLAEIEYENAQRAAGRYLMEVAHFYYNTPHDGDEVNVCLSDGTVKTGIVQFSTSFSGDEPIASVPLDDGSSLELYHYYLIFSVDVDGEILSYCKYKDGVCYPEMFDDVTAGYDMLVLRSSDGFCGLLCFEPTSDSALYESEDNYEEGIYSWYLDNIA